MLKLVILQLYSWYSTCFFFPHCGPNTPSQVSPYFGVIKLFNVLGHWSVNLPNADLSWSCIYIFYLSTFSSRTGLKINQTVSLSQPEVNHQVWRLTEAECVRKRHYDRCRGNMSEKRPLSYLSSAERAVATCQTELWWWCNIRRCPACGSYNVWRGHLSHRPSLV